MTFREQVSRAVKRTNSLVCVGLDCNRANIPKHLVGDDAVFNFAKAIVDATADIVCGFKPNSAFFEADGAEGIAQLKKICDYINEAYPGTPIILDAKRADIGNTNLGYATFAFDYLGVGAITINPYLGQEAVQPFLDYADKGLIILCRTSNAGSAEFQNLIINGSETKLYEHIAERATHAWNTNNNCALVVGATYPQELAEVRKIAGDDVLILVPGIGAQGGDLEQTLQAGLNTKGEGLIINSSRGIIFASLEQDFAEAARAETLELQTAINQIREKI